MLSPPHRLCIKTRLPGIYQASVANCYSWRGFVPVEVFRRRLSNAGLVPSKMSIVISLMARGPRWVPEVMGDAVRASQPWQGGPAPGQGVSRGHHNATRRWVDSRAVEQDKPTRSVEPRVLALSRIPISTIPDTGAAGRRDKQNPSRNLRAGPVRASSPHCPMTT